VWITTPNSVNWTFSILEYSSIRDKVGNQMPGTAVNTTGLPGYLMGFGTGADKEIYVLTSENQGPGGSTGKVWKILPG
jgi:hypothetical protein